MVATGGQCITKILFRQRSKHDGEQLCGSDAVLVAVECCEALSSRRQLLWCTRIVRAPNACWIGLWCKIYIRETDANSESLETLVHRPHRTSSSPWSLSYLFYAAYPPTCLMSMSVYRSSCSLSSRIRCHPQGATVPPSTAICFILHTTGVVSSSSRCLGLGMGGGGGGVSLDGKRFFVLSNDPIPSEVSRCSSFFTSGKKSNIISSALTPSVLRRSHHARCQYKGWMEPPQLCSRQRVRMSMDNGCNVSNAVAWAAQVLKGALWCAGNAGSRSRCTSVISASGFGIYITAS